MSINPIDQTKALTDRETYGFINTRSILDTFENQGWQVESTSP